MSRIVRRAGDLPTRSLWRKIKDVALMDVGVLAQGGIKPGSLERLEELLLEADFGVPVTLRLVDAVARRAQKGEVRTDSEFLATLREGVSVALRSGNSDPTLRLSTTAPTVILVVGVNGAGKTTFIAKLSERLRGEGKRVLLVAGDTFRAGAVKQLKIWAERTGAEFIAALPGADPAAVAYQAIDAAQSRNLDVVIIDTAGRLHTSADLMEELRKMVRVVAKRLPGAPHESLLVLDGTIGQNAVQQAKEFSAAVPISGLVMTKLDGIARGGIVIAAHEAIDVPVKFLGVGEHVEDLVPFDAAAFSEDLLAEK